MGQVIHIGARFDRLADLLEKKKTNQAKKEARPPCVSHCWKRDSVSVCLLGRNTQQKTQQRQRSEERNEEKRTARQRECVSIYIRESYDVIDRDAMVNAKHLTRTPSSSS